MLVTLTIIRYPKRYIPVALFAMALHRLPLWLNKKIAFYKLMGCGKNGTFDKHPDWQQWGILTAGAFDIPGNDTQRLRALYGPFIAGWLRWFGCETCTFYLEPIEGHGLWDGRAVFGELPKHTDYNGVVAILTRATIRWSKLGAFWRNVDQVAVQMAGAKGFVTSIGIGETPYVKQATFSIWQNKESMRAFAYQMQEHTAVIRKTRQENWYSEDMFVRFKPLKVSGSIGGVQPLAGIV